MLIKQLRHQGFGLVELLVVLVIVGILFSVGAPNLMTWTQNSQLRTAAESISAGLQLARAEAVRRNSSVRFQLTDTLDAACTLSPTGNNWVVSINDPTGLCDNIPTADAALPVVPRIVQKHSGAEGTPKAVIASLNPNGTASAVALVTFNGLGRASNAMIINVTNPSGGACQANGGTMRCLNIIVSTGGQTRMCNPSIPSTNPQGC